MRKTLSIAAVALSTVDIAQAPLHTTALRDGTLPGCSTFAISDHLGAVPLTKTEWESHERLWSLIDSSRAAGLTEILISTSCSVDSYRELLENQGGRIFLPPEVRPPPANPWHSDNSIVVAPFQISILSRDDEQTRFRIVNVLQGKAWEGCTTSLPIYSWNAALTIQKQHQSFLDDQAILSKQAIHERSAASFVPVIDLRPRLNQAGLGWEAISEVVDRVELTIVAKDGVLDAPIRVALDKKQLRLLEGSELVINGYLLAIGCEKLNAGNLPQLSTSAPKDQIGDYVRELSLGGVTSRMAVKHFPLVTSDREPGEANTTPIELDLTPFGLTRPLRAIHVERKLPIFEQSGFRVYSFGLPAQESERDESRSATLIEHVKRACSQLEADPAACRNIVVAQSNWTNAFALPSGDGAIMITDEMLAHPHLTEICRHEVLHLLDEALHLSSTSVFTSLFQRLRRETPQFFRNVDESAFLFGGEASGGHSFDAPSELFATAINGAVTVDFNDRLHNLTYSGISGGEFARAYADTLQSVLDANSSLGDKGLPIGLVALLKERLASLRSVKE